MINLVARLLLENQKDDYRNTKYYKNSLNSLKSVTKKAPFITPSHI